MLTISELGTVLESARRSLFRLEKWGYAYNGPAGQQARILDLADTPRPPELTLVNQDFWLVDDREVVLMHYHADGQFEGAEILDQQHVARHRAAAEVGWSLVVGAGSLSGVDVTAGRVCSGSGVGVCQVQVAGAVECVLGATGEGGGVLGSGPGLVRRELDVTDISAHSERRWCRVHDAHNRCAGCLNPRRTSGGDH